MTGFGDASAQIDGIHYAIEVRSLNNRYFKASVRLPEDIAGLEAELESLLRQKLNRGSITLSVKYRQSDAAAAHRINEEALHAYLSHLEKLQHQLAARNETGTIDLTALLAMPGVLQSADNSGLLDRARPAVTKLTHEACAKLIAMRDREGAAIADELQKHRQAILDRVGIVRQRAPLVVHEYHTRLKARVEELTKRAELKMDENDLLRELAIYAERCDVAEEVQRLSEHLVQVDTLINADGNEAAGRTLDFITQELLREANTIASKSNDAAISKAIVEVKGLIDRIKEQVQNVE
jgi:uncharacterized protein (TIGR00255 family)